jgi:hypothetical protein
MFKQEILRLLGELCPSYVEKKQKKASLSTSSRESDDEADEIDDSKDIVDNDSMYVYWFWKEYKRYPERSTIGSLWKCQLEIANEEKKVAAKIPRLWNAWLEKKKKQFEDEQERIFAALLESCEMKETMRFKQGDYTPGLENKIGICFAMSLDWIRRKIWNSQISDEKKRKKETWDQKGLDKRLRRLDALQTVKKNFFDPKITLSAYDTERTKNRKSQEKKTDADFASKSFAALMQGGRHETFDQPKDTALEDNVQHILAKFDSVRKSMGDTFGVLFEVNGRGMGHAYALFCHRRQWSLFDPNLGEFLLRSEPRKVIIDWFEIYHALGMVDMLVTGISQPS